MRVIVPVMVLALAACSGPASTSPTSDACTQANADMRRIAQESDAMPHATSDERAERLKRMRTALQIAVDRPGCFTADVVTTSAQGIHEIDKKLAGTNP